MDEVLVVDGWSTDGTAELLGERLPHLEKNYGKRVELIRDELRNAGKGAGMVTGIKWALAGHDCIIFLDADIASMTSKWCDVLVEGIDGYNVAMTRGYLDAQITRHIIRTVISMFFPEGRKVNQPLGGEHRMTSDLARYLLDCGIAPPSTWGIDTFLTINTVMGGYRIAELYLTQKTHNRKSMDQLKTMFIECFEEAVQEVHFHGRDKQVPSDVESLVEVVPCSATDIERVGEDVRTQVYVDLDEQIGSFFAFVEQLGDTTGLLDELGVSAEYARLLQDLLAVEVDFRERSVELGIKEWIRILDSLARGYIARRFSSRYHNLLFAIWKLRTLTYCLNEPPASRRRRGIRPNRPNMLSNTARVKFKPESSPSRRKAEGNPSSGG